MTLLADIFMNNNFFCFFRILYEIMFLFPFLALTSLCLLANSCGKNPSNIRRLGFCGWSSYGDPEKSMEAPINYVLSYKKTNNKFPSTEEVKKRMLGKKLRFIFYSYSSDNDCFQVAWWSGETTWIYDSRTNIYYETTLDMMHERWFAINESKNNIPSDVKYINLYE